MKNVFFMAAFLLLGSFASASNFEESAKIENELQSTLSKTKIDFDTFKQMFDLSEISPQDLVFNFKEISFDFTDSCGNNWEVSYDDQDFTVQEVVDILIAIDPILCILAE